MLTAISIFLKKITPDGLAGSLILFIQHHERGACLGHILVVLVDNFGLQGYNPPVFFYQ